MFGWYQNCFYLCNRFSEVKYSGCSAVRLAHLLWEQGVVGSNPATPTDESQGVTVKCSSFFLFSEWGGLPFGKSSVSCPLKPSDSAPLKHSTMPP